MSNHFGGCPWATGANPTCTIQEDYTKYSTIKVGVEIYDVYYFSQNNTDWVVPGLSAISDIRNKIKEI